MDRLKQLSLLLIVAINSSLLFAQKSTTAVIEKNITISTSETVYIYTNNDAFVTGETLYYQLYSLNPINFKPSQISKIAHIQLLTSENKVVTEQKLALKNGVGNGDIFIPSNINSGTYKLVGYTNWSLNKNDYKFFTKDITIVNPFQLETKDLIRKSIVSSNTTDVNTNNQTTALGTLTSVKKNYSQRELIHFKLNPSQKINAGNYAVSVRKIDAFKSNKTINSTAFSKVNTASEIPNVRKSITILPELRGEIISGKISTSNNQNPINTISVGLSIPGEDFYFKIVKTNEYGAFFFTIDQEYTNPNLIIQVVNPNRKEYEITINDNQKIDLNTTATDFPVDQTMLAAIKDRAIATQIENAYFNSKKDSIESKNSSTSFYKPLEKDYILDNYNRFPTLLETITEVLKEVYYTKNGNQYSFGVRDYDETIEVPEPTLVMVDGILIQDGNELIDLKMDTVYKISIIQGGYHYGSNIFNGMISIISKNHDYELKSKGSFILKNNQIIANPKKEYFTPNHSKEENKRIPDYRHQLLWMPQYDVKNDISFYTSDVTGAFEITIEGFTNDGEPVSIRETFEVN